MIGDGATSAGLNLPPSMGLNASRKAPGSVDIWSDISVKVQAKVGGEGEKMLEKEVTSS